MLIDPDRIQRVLYNAKTIAIVGLSRNELRASYFVGFYLQPAVGGRVLGRDFWTRLAALESVYEELVRLESPGPALFKQERIGQMMRLYEKRGWERLALLIPTHLDRYLIYNRPRWSEAVEMFEAVQPFGTDRALVGHQLLATALGGETYKLPFGHHGGNHPVQRLRDGAVEITSQNHNYAVAEGSLPSADVTHVNLNDGVVEGLRCRDVPAFSVQYHPEAGPGPHDARYLFAQFEELIRGGA